jgi:hypothetical protein
MMSDDAVVGSLKADLEARLALLVQVLGLQHLETLSGTKREPEHARRRIPLLVSSFLRPLSLQCLGRGKDRSVSSWYSGSAGTSVSG